MLIVDKVDVGFQRHRRDCDPKFTLHAMYKLAVGLVRSMSALFVKEVTSMIIVLKLSLH